jgi:cytoskeleton protein RodZ
MDSIGERLRQERVRRGWEIEEIAERTKIGPSLLQAIENNDLSKLPGSFFTRSFVRQYARALGLDEAEFDSELNQLAGPPQPPEPEEKPAGIRERIHMQPIEPSRPVRGGFGGPLIAFVLVLAICSVVYTFWQRARSASSASEPARTEAQAKPKPKPAGTTPDASAAIQPAAQVASAPAPAPVPAQAPAATTPEPAPPTTAVAQAAPAPAASAPVRVELRATGPAWVRVTADGKVLFSGTIEAGQSQTFEAKEIIRVRTGNAGGLEAALNGKPAGPLGNAGQVRELEFTPSQFRIVPPTPLPPAN